MIARRRQLQVALQLVGDVVATGLAVVVAYWLRFGLEVVPVTKGQPPTGPYLLLIPLTMILWPAVFYFQGLYGRRTARFRRRCPNSKWNWSTATSTRLWHTPALMTARLRCCGGKPTSTSG